MYGHLKKYKQYVFHFIGFAEVFAESAPTISRPALEASPPSSTGAQPSPAWKPACLSLKHIVGQTKYARPKLIRTIEKPTKTSKTYEAKPKP